jgi:signal transduction histidine kinase
MSQDAPKVDITLQQFDELRQRADELPAPQQELLGEVVRIISTTLAAARASPDRVSVWKEMLTHTREAFEGEQPKDHKRESSLPPVFEDFKGESEASRAIGLAQIPDDVLCALLSNRYLSPASRIAIVVFDKPWDEDSPAYATVLAEWHSSPEQADLVGVRFHFGEDDALRSLFSREVPLVIEDVGQDERFGQPSPDLIDQPSAVGLILYPLVAGGKWYGMLTAHYAGTISRDIIPHIRGLLDQAAVAIYTMLLFEAETKARREAEKANDHKMKLLATISHEMRTPLTSIKGFATTLLADDVEWSPDSQRDFIETINQEADKLTELIEHLLSHSRLEAGTLPITPKRKQMQDIISVAMAQIQTLTANHDLRVHIPADLPPVRADSRRIAQVLTNLVKNAVEYSPQQTEVEITASAQGGYVRVDVSDQGLGIPPEEHPHVFEAFHRGTQAKEARKKGAGLGLAICKGIVEAHGGEIWVQGRSEPGTTISFTLPVFESDESEVHDGDRSDR